MSTDLGALTHQLTTYGTLLVGHSRFKSEENTDATQQIFEKLV